MTDNTYAREDRQYGVLAVRALRLAMTHAKVPGAMRPLLMGEFSHAWNRQLPPPALGDQEAYELDFQRAVTRLVFEHIDRMNDVCPEDSAERILASLTGQLTPLLDIYFEAAFPGRERPHIPPESDHA